ncbi:hypothetical protein [Caballeronia sp. M23-90]
MAEKKRETARPGMNRAPLSKSLLLPMAAHSARELSLAHHLALASCRGDSGNRYQINELTRSVYMAYFLQRFSAWGLVICCLSFTNGQKPRLKIPLREQKNPPHGQSVHRMRQSLNVC